MATADTGDFTSFLNDGRIPTGSAVKSLTSQTILPDWYTNYAMDILSGQQGIAGQPYQTFQGPRVADINAMQQRGFNQTLAQANAYVPGMRSATEATQSLMGQGALPQAQPYFTRAAGMDPSQTAMADYNASRGALGQAGGINIGGAASPYYSGALGMDPNRTAASDYDASRGLVNTSQGYDAVGAATPYYGQAASMNALNAASPYFGGAANFAMQSTRGSGLEAAMPWLQAASGNVANVDDYMNPYQDAVVNRIADLGARNLRDVLMPSIEGRYISAGQLGGSGQYTDTARAIRDISADVLAQQADMMNKGYVQAQGFKQGDLGRYGQLGATAGNLMGQDMSTLLGAGRTLADIGATAGNLTAGQQSLLANMGTNLGNLTTAQQRGALDAAQQLGALGTQAGQFTAGQQRLMGDIGTQMGGFARDQQRGALDVATGLQNLGTAGAGLTAQQQELLANLGINVGSLAGSDITRSLGAAQQMGALAGLQQSYGLTGAGALTGVGNQLQQQQQQNLDVAYSDFLRQQGYPQEQIDKMLATFKGVGQGVPTASKEFGIVPTGQPVEYKPSTGAQIGSALAGVGGLIDAIGSL